MIFYEGFIVYVAEVRRPHMRVQLSTAPGAVELVLRQALIQAAGRGSTGVACLLMDAHPQLQAVSSFATTRCGFSFCFQAAHDYHRRIASEFCLLHL